MKRIYYTTGRRLGYRSFSKIEGPDVVELKRMLHALGYWRPALAAFPDAPALNALRNQELRRTNPAAFEKEQAQARRLATEYQRDFGQYDAEAIAAVDKFREDKGLNYPGNPSGLVDDRLVAALKAAYYEKRRSKR